MIAALFVDPRGAYSERPDVDCWGEDRDARGYGGPLPVVAHPPCARWSKATVFAEGGFRARGKYRIGEDGGCFRAALAAVRRWGGVLEHPMYSRAFRAFGIAWPPKSGGWARTCDDLWVCAVWQGHYGHPAPKPTWLVLSGRSGYVPPALEWGPSPETEGMRRRRFSGVSYGTSRGARTGKYTPMEILTHKERAATPPPFRDLLIQLATEAAPA